MSDLTTINDAYTWLDSKGFTQDFLDVNEDQWEALVSATWRGATPLAGLATGLIALGIPASDFDDAGAPGSVHDAMVAATVAS